LTLKVAFAGTPAFAERALHAILAAGFEVPLVLTQPDRPAGRGMQVQMSAVKTLALQHGLAIAQPRSLRLDGKFADAAREGEAALQAARADVLVVAAYGLILPQWVLDLPRLGCLNIHGSLLPRWRGAAPIHRAIEAGDLHTGITIMQMDVGLDTGDMLLAQSVPIDAAATTATLHDTLAALGAQLIVQALQQLEGGLPRTPQPQAGVTYAHKIDKAEAALDFTQSAVTLCRKIRAFDPFPGCSATLDGSVVKLWHAVPSSEQGAPGTVLRADAHGVLVACGEGATAVTELQRAGGKRLSAQAFLAGQPVAVGQCFS
jgi:methionyl-tRNA formyltransferase